MSPSIDPREVKEHLEYLGYSNITVDQLKDFIKDLKRLIKYEQNKANKVDCPAEERQFDLHSPVAQRRHLTVTAEVHDPPKNTTETYSEEQRRLTSSYGSPRSFNEECPSASGPSSDDRSHFGRSYHPNDYIDENLTYKECENPSCSCCRKMDRQLKSSQKKFLEMEKPPPSFIRPGKCKPSKCDPVALYHYYQSQWSKRPLPGEDPRSDLRWAIRTRLAQQQKQGCQQKVSCTEPKQKREWIS